MLSLTLLFSLIGLVPLVFIAWAMTYNLYQKDEIKQQSWQSLVDDAPSLRFYTGGLGEKTYLRGFYGGYDLKLEAFSDGNKHFTRIIVSRSYESQRTVVAGAKAPLTSRDILRILKPYSLRHRLRGKLHARPHGTQIYYTQPGIETDLMYISFLFGLLCDLADVYPALVILGGEAVPELHKIINGPTKGLHPLTHQLLRDIGQTTEQKLGHHLATLLCPHCLTRFTRQQIALTPSQFITVCGCRRCGQSVDYLSGKLIAVLDDRMDTALYQTHDLIYANWLLRWTLFDFDTVEIRQASDAVIERFVRQVVKDALPPNRYRYRGMTCFVRPEAHLSQQTIGLLQRGFGWVVVEAEGDVLPDAQYDSPQSSAIISV